MIRTATDTHDAATQYSVVCKAAATHAVASMMDTEAHQFPISWPASLRLLYSLVVDLENKRELLVRSLSRNTCQFQNLGIFIVIDVVNGFETHLRPVVIG